MATNFHINILELPDVALLNILSNLETKDALNICKVHDRLKDLCTENAVAR